MSMNVHHFNNFPRISTELNRNFYFSSML